MDRWHSLGAMVAQWLSALAGLSFAAAAIFNGWIFDGWGLNFLQIASAADVLNSGIDLFFRLLAPALGCTSGWFAARGLIFLTQENEFWSSAIKKTAFLPGIISMLAAAYVVCGGVFSPLTFIYAFSAGYYYSYDVAIGSTPRLFIFVFVIPLFIAIVSLGFKNVSEVSRYGFEPRRILVEAGYSCAGDVLWIGDRSIVVHCKTGEVDVIYGGENVRMSMRQIEEWPRVASLRALKRRDQSHFQKWIQEKVGR